MNREKSALAKSSREAGSAYVLVLLVLLVLTLLGLVLALTTQTEVQVGANERIANRIFYAADAAFADAYARLSIEKDNRGRVYTLKDPGLPTSIRVEVTPFHSINDAPCNLCEINQGTDYYKITHAANAVATRFGPDGNGGEVVLAQKRLGLMLDMEPDQLTTIVQRSVEDSGIQEIKF